MGVKVYGEFYDYTTALAFLDGKPRRPTGRPHTHVAGNEAGVSVIFHDTAIVTYYPDESIELSTGGHTTFTTVERMNTFLPGRLYVSRSHGRMQVRMRQTVDGPLRSDPAWFFTYSCRVSAGGHVDKIV